MPVTSLTRRQGVRVGSMVLRGSVAVSSNANRIDEIAEAVEHVKAVDHDRTAVSNQVQSRESGIRLGGVRDMGAELNTPKDGFQSRPELAEEEGRAAHVEDIKLLSEYLGLLEDMIDEMELPCEAGQNENDIEDENGRKQSRS